MSRVHIVISKNKLDNILKERYLKFNEIKYDNKGYCGFYIYSRYDEANICFVNEDQYSISKKLLAMLHQHSNNNKLFFATCSLNNKESDETYLKYFLNCIYNKTAKKINSDILDFNELYQLSD